MNYKLITYIFLMVICLITLVGILFFEVSAMYGFIFLGPVAAYFIKIGLRKRKDKCKHVNKNIFDK